MKILAFIPAKTDSVRLPQKNLQLIGNKTLVEHSIDYALASKHDVSIIVSTESWDLHNKILNKYGFDTGVFSDIRDPSMCGETEVVDVYFDFVNELDYDCLDEIELFVALQPDHPDREHTFDECVSYFVDNNYDDLITVEENYKRSGSVRIFKMEHLINGNVSKRIGILKDSATDIHYESDLAIARAKMQK